MGKAFEKGQKRKEKTYHHTHTKKGYSNERRKTTPNVPAKVLRLMSNAFDPTANECFGPLRQKEKWRLGKFDYNPFSNVAVRCGRVCFIVWSGIFALLCWTLLFSVGRFRLALLRVVSSNENKLNAMCLISAGARTVDTSNGVGRPVLTVKCEAMAEDAVEFHHQLNQNGFHKK